MKTFFAVWILTHAWFISIGEYLARHQDKWWQHFSWRVLWRDVQAGWKTYIDFLRTLPDQWAAQSMDFVLHFAVSLLATMLACVCAKVFFNFGRGGLYPFAALLISLVLVSLGAYVLIVMIYPLNPAA